MGQKYIRNLTETIIGQIGFDEYWDEVTSPTYVWHQYHTKIGNLLKKMKPETRGKIIAEGLTWKPKHVEAESGNDILTALATEVVVEEIAQIAADICEVVRRNTEVDRVMSSKTFLT